MTQETMEDLGFTEENSIKTEEERKKELAMKFIKINEEAKKGVENYFRDLYKNQNASNTETNSGNQSNPSQENKNI